MRGGGEEDLEKSAQGEDLCSLRAAAASHVLAKGALAKSDASL
jgi:hypothetical protein